MAPQTFLVTAATGTVGRPLTLKLLALGHKVHALTTNLQSDRAIALQNAGATLFKAELDDKPAITAAAKSCTGLYLNPMPANMANHFNEATYAQNIIDASRAAGVRTCVCQSVENTDEVTTLPEWGQWISTAGIVAYYWNMKIAIQNAVRDAGFDSWTSIQGGFHMSNFSMRYINMLFPGVRDKPTGTLSFAVRPETPLHLIDPADLAELAVQALVDPSRYNGKNFNAIGEELTLAQIAEILGRHAGKPMQAHHPDLQEVREKRDSELSAGNGLVLDLFGTRTNADVCRSSGIKFNTLDDYLKDKEEDLRQAVA